MNGQGILFDTRSETRPLRTVVSIAWTSERRCRMLLSCGHSLENVHYSQESAKRKRCNLCAAYGKDDTGLKYKVSECST
jgi:hypothetical protein